MPSPHCPHWLRYNLDSAILKGWCIWCFSALFQKDPAWFKRCLLLHCLSLHSYSCLLCLHHCRNWEKHQMQLGLLLLFKPSLCEFPGGEKKASCLSSCSAVPAALGSAVYQIPTAAFSSFKHIQLESHPAFIFNSET